MKPTIIIPALLLALATGSSVAQAQSEFESPAPAVLDGEPQVRMLDLSGPRAGVTLDRLGNATSQFGWHFEHRARASRRGPMFVVETVLLVGGVERQMFLPSGSLIFGARTPGGFEFGLGPSVALGGPNGASR